MNRRGFLGRMIAGTAGLVLAEDLLWKPVHAQGLELLRPDAIVGLRQLTREVARLLERRVGAQVFTESDNYLLGSTAGGYVVDHQVHVNCEYPDLVDHHGMDVERYVRPCAEALVDRIAHDKIKAFVPMPMLPLDSGFECCTVVSDGIAVRGVTGWTQMPFPQMVLRFDVLGCG